MSHSPPQPLARSGRTRLCCSTLRARYANVLITLHCSIATRNRWRVLSNFNSRLITQLITQSPFSTVSYKVSYSAVHRKMTHSRSFEQTAQKYLWTIMNIDQKFCIFSFNNFALDCFYATRFTVWFLYLKFYLRGENLNSLDFTLINLMCILLNFIVLFWTA